MLKVADVAQQLNCAVSTVYALVESGRLPCHRIGCGRGAVRVSDEDLAAYLNQSRSLPTVAAPAPEPNRRVKLKHLRIK